MAKRIATEWCATGIGRDPTTGLMRGAMCFFQKRAAQKYIRAMKRLHDDSNYHLTSRRVLREVKRKATLSGVRRRKRR